MGKKMLLGCFEPPGWGGASTNLYLLFERMQEEGFDVAYASLISSRDKTFFQRLYGNDFGNPRRLNNVYTVILEEPLWGRQAGLANLIDRLSPDFLFGRGCIGARLMKLAAPHLAVVLMTSGSRQVQHLVAAGMVRDFMAFQRSVEHGVVFPVRHEDPEAQAAECSDLILIHSAHVRFAFEHFFPGHADKIYSNVISVADLVYPEAARFKGLKRSFTDRDIDVIFVASRWSRFEKNYALVHKVISHCEGLNIHVVGDVDQRCLPAEYHGVISRREALYELLGRSKVLVCPSLMDAAPGILFEASAMDCNVVASPNCGNWQLCNKELLAEECSLDPFLAKIRLSLSEPFKDNRECFRDGYEELVETLGGFQP